MVKLMKKIPAGTILLPMLVSAILYTVAPTLFYTGGMTQALFSGDIVMPVLSLLCFSSGLGIDVSDLPAILKKQGSLIIIKVALAIGLGVLFLNIFGHEGFLGISSLAFISIISTTNPALYLSLTEEYGSENDVKAYGLMGMLGMPVLPMLVFSLSNIQNMDWSPIFTTLFPLIVGIILGNLDDDLRSLMSPIIPALMPVLGWGLGQGINLVNSLSAGFSGILLALIFYICLSPTLLFERLVLKENGVASIAMMSVPGSSLSFPGIIAATVPAVSAYANEATAQMTLALIIVTIVTPILTKKIAQSGK